MAFTVSDSVWKRLDTIENVQENKVYTSVFVEQENNRQTSCFHVIHH